MATMIAADVEPAVPFKIRPPQLLSRAYNAIVHRAERNLPRPVAEMSDTPEVRRRAQSGQLARVIVENGESSPESDQPVTPSSSAEQEQVQEQRESAVGSSATAILDNLLSKIGLSRNSRSPPEEVEILNPSRRFDNLITEKVEDYPEGYPQLAGFMNSDDTFANVRRFGRLSSRLLLHLQNELTALEKQLDDLDKSDAANKVLEKRLRGYEHFSGWTDQQTKLLNDIQAKYSQYADIALKDARFRALGKLPRRNYEASFTWVWNEQPFDTRKFDYIFHQDDFVSLAGHSGSQRQIENFIEWLLDGCWTRIKLIFQSKDELRKAGGSYVYYYSSTRLKVAAGILYVSLAVGLLLVPAYILFLVSMSKPMMAVTVTIALIAFSVILSIFTGAKVQEVFFGTAGYAAVTIMFLCNLNQGFVPGSGT